MFNLLCLRLTSDSDTELITQLGVVLGASGQKTLILNTTKDRSRLDKDCPTVFDSIFTEYLPILEDTFSLTDSPNVYCSKVTDPEALASVLSKQAHPERAFVGNMLQLAFDYVVIIADPEPSLLLDVLTQNTDSICPVYGLGDDIEWTPTSQQVQLIGTALVQAGNNSPRVLGKRVMEVDELADTMASVNVLAAILASVIVM